MGVVLAAMLHVTEVTGDTSFQDYAFKNFDFIFTHLPYFKRQALELRAPGPRLRPDDRDAGARSRRGHRRGARQGERGSSPTRATRKPLTSPQPTS